MFSPRSWHQLDGIWTVEFNRQTGACEGRSTSAMPEERDLLERRLSREDLLKLAAVTAGAGLVAGRTRLAPGASPHLPEETRPAPALGLGPNRKHRGPAHVSPDPTDPTDNQP